MTNYTIKILAVLGEIPPLSVQIKMNANDNNVAPVAVGQQTQILLTMVS